MGQFFLYLLLLTIVFCYITTTSVTVTVTSLYQAFSNIPHNKIRNKYMYDSCLYRIVLISVSANTQGYNIGIVSEVKKSYRDIPNTHQTKESIRNKGGLS